jgi:hypothetical protein
MVSTICTVFERDFHIGLAALINSLYGNGFRGTVWAGYRGSLPPWSKLPDSTEIQDFKPTTDLTVRFVPLSTQEALIRYKPEFMMQIIESSGADLRELFYLDSDIVVNAPWSFFQDWITYGIAVCEDINSPVHHTHPVRGFWRKNYASNDIALRRELDVYVNGGFLGLTKENFGFLEHFRRIKKLYLSTVTSSGDRFLEDQRVSLYSSSGEQDALILPWKQPLCLSA